MIIGVVALVILGILLSMGVWTMRKPEKIVYKEKVVYQESKTKKITDIKKYENIVFLGDSITDFYPIDSIYMDLPIVKSGISGYTTNDILERMDSMVYQYNPTSVFLLIGTNDIMFDESNEESAIENIEKIISNIKENRKKAKIYLESIYPVNKEVNSKMVRNRDNETIKDMNSKLKNYCEENDIVYINMHDELTDEEGNFDAKYTDDGLHPNDLGYAKISQMRLTYMYGIEVEK